MNKLVYLHSNDDSCRKGTIAIELPNKSDLTSTLNTYANGILLNIGAARLSPKERFNKKLGRSYAEKLITPTKCYLESLSINDQKHVYNFRAVVTNRCPRESATQDVYFGLAVNDLSDGVRLVYGGF